MLAGIGVGISGFILVVVECSTSARQAAAVAPNVATPIHTLLDRKRMCVG